MLNQTSDEFRALFLLQFTKELIKHAGASEVFELKEILKEEGKEKRKKIKYKIKGRKTVDISDLEKPLPKTRVLRVPAQKPPAHLQYLKPARESITEIELGKLDNLIKDPAISDIECNGPNENIIVKGTMGTKKTNIILTKEEIDEIIKKFSDAAKTPVHQGFFKVVAGKMSLTAVISEITGSRFIIKKMKYAPVF